MKSEVNAVIDQLEAAAHSVKRIEGVAARLADSPLAGEERAWLESAAQRLSASIPPLRATLEQSLALPELKALRIERQTRLEQDWLLALRELFSELQEQVGANSPLIEALFPHQRFERLERSGAAQRAYRAEFSLRRSSTYVCRLVLDPEYPFLGALLEPVERSEKALMAFEAATSPSDEELERLRESIREYGRALGRVQRQARALAEAALVEAPELFAELGFDARGRRRSTAPEDAASEN